MTVGEIRHAIYLRQKGRCVMCDGPITENQMHMHERHARGKFIDGKFGEISFENSEGLCAYCHLQVEHGDRQPQFKKDKIVLDKDPEAK